MRRLLIGLIVLLALLIAADRIGDYVAERAAAKSLQSSQHLPSRPDVDIGGFPFLNQLAAGDFDRITISATDVPLGSRARNLTFAQLHVVLNGLTVSRDFERFHARTATANARIDYAALGKALGIDLTYAGEGRVRASKDVTIAGHTLHASMTSRPELTSDAALTFAVRLPLTDIPFDIRVTALRVTDTGLMVDLAGRNLTYVR